MADEYMTESAAWKFIASKLSANDPVFTRSGLCWAVCYLRREYTISSAVDLWMNNRLCEERKRKGLKLTDYFWGTPLDPFSAEAIACRIDFALEQAKRTEGRSNN